MEKDKRGITKLGVNLIYLYILNLSDLFCTNFVLKRYSNIFYEANCFMRPIVSTNRGYLIKIGGVFLLLIYWYIRSKKSQESELKKSLIASKLLITLYVVINIIHLFNFLFIICVK